MRQPAIRRLGLVELQLFLKQIAQAVQQLALQSVFRCGHRLCRITSEFLGDGGTIGLDHQFPEHPGMLVLPCHDVQQRSPQRWEAAEPVKDEAIKYLVVQQAGSCTVQAVLAILAVTESVGLLQWTMPGVPQTAVGMLDMQVNSDLADVVKQRGVGGDGGPSFGLSGLVFGCCASGQSV